MLAIDQYGQTVRIAGKHPRKELLETLGYKHADRVYIDRAGAVIHVGYIIGGRWFAFYRPVEFGPA